MNSSLKDAQQLTRKAFKFSKADEILLFVRREMIKRFKSLEDYFR